MAIFLPYAKKIDGKKSKGFNLRGIYFNHEIRRV
jgi:hypothetical protein